MFDRMALRTRGEETQHGRGADFLSELLYRSSPALSCPTLSLEALSSLLLLCSVFPAATFQRLTPSRTFRHVYFKER